MGQVILSYILLTISFCWIAYFSVDILLKRWEEKQKRKAEEITTRLEEMFIFLRPIVIVVLYIVFPLASFFFIFLLTKKIWLSLLALGVGLIFPLWFVKSIEYFRRKKFIVQLVDGLMILNSCLKGGLTLAQSFGVLAEEMTPPLSQEISLLNREIKVGMPLEEALIRLERRMPSEEMTLISSAILVARETGGDLTKVFSRLIETIRDRIKLKELISTLTMQARLQAFIISMLGPVFFIIVRKIRPDHFDIMWQNSLGRILLLIALVLQIVGVILIIIFGRIRV